jgi:hypothetical protein
MGKRTEAYETLGVALRNPRNAWSGRNKERVVVTAWDDYFDRSGPELLYRFKPLTVYKKAGRKWLVEDLQYAIDCCDRIVHVVLAKVKDPTKHPREIATCAAQLNMVFEIVEFDPVTAGYTARVIYRPVEPTPRSDHNRLAA